MGALADTIDRAIEFGRHDNLELQDLGGLPEDERVHVRDRVRAQRLLLMSKGALWFLAKSPTQYQFSASLGFFFAETAFKILDLLAAVDRAGAEAFCNGGPDRKLAYEISWFIATRLLEEDELDEEAAVEARLDFDKYEDAAEARMWAREVALVALEIREKIRGDGLQAEASELADGARRLNAVLNDRKLSDATIEEFTNLWSEYTDVTATGEPIPRPGDSALKPLFFQLIWHVTYYREKWYLTPPTPSENQKDGGEALTLCAVHLGSILTLP